MKKSIFIIIAASFLMTSCNEFLSELPKGQIVAKTTADFRKLLDNADTRYTHNLTQSSSFVDVVSDDSKVSFETWDEWDRDRLHAHQLYAFKNEVWLPDGPTTDDVWKQNYYVNTLVCNILKEIFRADDNKKLQQQLIAEAKVHRAYAYLTLVNIYAKHYNAQTASTDLGVPIILDPVELPRLTRSSVQEVYDFILSELLSSVDALPADVSQYKHRPTKVSTYAILARTYLYMGNYEKALEYANKSLAIRNVLYDYNDIYTGTPRAENVKGLSLTNDKEMLLLKTTIKSLGLSTYMQLDTSSFNAVYSGFHVIDSTGEVKNNDLRRILWFDGFDSEGKAVSEYVTYVFSDANHRYSLDNNSYVDYIAVSTPEMYLIRSESNARLGNLQEAIDDINTIRMNRYKEGSYTNLTLSDFGNSKEAVIEETLLERRRELYGKELRLFDVKRLGLPVTHPLGTDEVSVPAHDPKLIWPIFNEYITLNPELEQNPR